MPSTGTATVIEPVIPIPLNKNWNIISRTILPVIHQDDIVERSSQTGLGDIVQSLFFSHSDPADLTRHVVHSRQAYYEGHSEPFPAALIIPKASKYRLWPIGATKRLGSNLL